MIKQKKLWDNILTVIMALLCLLWIYPIVLILLNSLKKEGTLPPLPCSSCPPVRPLLAFPTTSTA